LEEWKGGRIDWTIDDGPWLTGDGGREKRPQGFSRWTLEAGTDAGAGSEPERQVLETPGVFWCWTRGIAVRGIRMPGIGMPGLQLSTKLVRINGMKLISVHG
jgi:hypothetical protein